MNHGSCYVTDDCLPSFTLSAEGKILGWNRACEKITGLRSEDMIGTTEHWRPFFREKTPLLADKLLLGDYSPLEKAEFVHKVYGVSLPLYSTIVQIELPIQGETSLWTQAGCILAEDGKLTSVWQTFQIIPSALISFRTDSPVIRAFVKKFPLPVALVRNERVCAANQAYAKLAGYSKVSDIIGMHPADFIDKSDKERFLSLNRNRHAGLQSDKVYSWRYNVGGEIRHVEGRPTIFHWGRDTILISTVIDVTESIRREARLRADKCRLEEEKRVLLEKIPSIHHNFIGKGPRMRHLLDRAIHLASSDMNIVILGETGTGKNTLARIIHEISSRREHPFVIVNCAAIPEQLLESEFFGYQKGAFTGAVTDKLGFLGMAHQGTLFLDEVGELSLAMQAKLLHALERKKYIPLGGTKEMESDVRLVCATNSDLLEMVHSHSMREDFFYRIFVGDLVIPPLRERKNDLPELISFFFKKFSTTDVPPKLPNKLLERFLSYSWPGNVRELQNVILRYLATGELHFFSSRSPVVELARMDSKEDIEGMAEEGVLSLEQCRMAAERRCIMSALQKCGGRKDRAAELLGLNIRTFHRYCTRLGIKRACN